LKENVEGAVALLAAARTDGAVPAFSDATAAGDFCLFLDEAEGKTELRPLPSLGSKEIVGGGG
jgi:hypothetical protein